MIKFLAQLFRGLHSIIEFQSLPGHQRRMYVFAWLGGIAFIVPSS